LPYCSYDFNKDGVITKEDIHTILSYMPVISQIETPQIENPGGKIQQEGGNATTFKKRLEILE